MKTKKRLLSILLSLVMVLGLIPGMSLVSLAANAAQSGENAYVKYSVGTRASSYEGFTVQGKSGDTWLATTFRNEGFETAMQVEGSGSPLYFTSPKFSYGGEYTQDGVTAYITARLQSNKVLIDYTVINNNDTAKTVNIGSYGDVQIGTNDSAPVSSIDGGGILMTDGTNEFKLIPGSGDSFTTSWYGNYGSAKNNVFVDLNPKNPLTDEDSGLAWSWTITVPANESITKTVALSAGAANTFMIDYNANGGSGTMSSTGAEYDTTVKLEKNGFTREGYAFEGWDTDSAGMTVVYEDEAEITMPNTDTTLYAVWKENTEITAAAEGFEGAYDGKEHGITVTVTDPSSGATIKYGKTAGTYDLDASPTITNVVDSPLTVYFKVTANGYKGYTGSATVTINKANAVPATVTANNRAYDGTEQPLVTVSGEPAGGEMQYAIGTETAATQPYTTSIPTATDAGTYYVWYKAVGDDNHSDSDAAYVEATIKSVTAGITLDPDKLPMNVGGKETIKATVVPEGSPVTWTTDKESVATVDTEGNVTGVSEGTAKIKGTITFAGKDYSAECEVTVVTPGITFDADKLPLKAGEKKTITAKVVPEETAIKWTTDKESVATVDTEGNVTAVSEGTAIIKGTISVDGKDYSAECKVTVTNETPVVTPSVKFDLAELSLKNGEEKTIKATVVPEDAKVTWTSDKEAVATVDANGTVKAVSEGTATITGKITVDGKDYSAECKVTATAGQTEYLVVPKDLSDDNISSEIIERYGTVTEVKAVIKEAAGVAPEQTGNFELLDAQIIVIENGVARPATAADIKPEGLEAIFPYPEGTNKNQVFEGVHMIGEDSGGYKAGDTEQLAFTNEDDGLHATVHGLSPVIITWKDPTPVPTEAGITLSASEIYVTQGRESAITATIKPEDAKVTWSSSDTSVARVDGTGVVSGIKPGTATITATITVDGKEYTASCKVTVIPAGSPMPIPVPSGSHGGGEHVHKYVWNTIEATEDTDGELRYQCETCGDIQTRVPLTAYNVFNMNTTEKIRKAPKDSTVKIETNKWISFHKMVMEALAERPDVTLEVSFLDEGHKGNRCTVVIPKGTDTMSLVDKNGFTGFLFLGGKFGMKTN